MPSLLRKVLLICAFVTASVAMATTGDGRSHSFGNLYQDDVIFTDNLLFSAQVYSKGECALRCSQIQSCKSFTFNEGSRSCRGHTSRMTENPSVSSSSGTQAYLLTDPEYGCSEVKEYDQANGAHTMHVNGVTFTAYCDQTTDGGNWTVFVNRKDGSVNFTRTWQPYENGFGDKDGEYWLGLRNLHALTNGSRQYELRVDIGDWDGATAYAVYDVFRVDGPDVNYTLHVTGYHGTAGDSLENAFWGSANNMPFSTPDRDHDQLGDENCADKYHLGWWINSCMYASPTGRYFNISNGMMWMTWKGYYSFRTMNLKIRPVN